MSIWGSGQTQSQQGPAVMRTRILLGGLTAGVLKTPLQAHTSGYLYGGVPGRTFGRTGRVKCWPQDGSTFARCNGFSCTCLNEVVNSHVIAGSVGSAADSWLGISGSED